MPKWITTLDKDHWLKSSVYDAVKRAASGLNHIGEVNGITREIGECEYVTRAGIDSIDLGSGCARVSISLKNDLFYKILGEATGLEIAGESELMPTMIELARIKKEFEKFKGALEEVEATGYGIVMPTIDELSLEEPEIIKQGGKYGVRLKASAPSIHMMKANITAEVNPIVGSEKQSEDLVMYLLKEFEENPQKIWESNIFGKSLHELVNEGLARQAVPYAAGRTSQASGNDRADHQRRMQRPDLYYFVRKLHPYCGISLTENVCGMYPGKQNAFRVLLFRRF